MIIDEFHTNVELYKLGMFSYIQFYDAYQDSIFKFHAKQIEALEKLNDNQTVSIGYGGAARGGKSALIALAALFESYAFPQSRQLMGRKDLTQFNSTTFKTLMRALDNFGFTKGTDYNHNKQSNEINFYEPNSEIVIKNLQLRPSDKDATAFGSLEISNAFIDQSENIELKIIEKIIERVGSYGTIKHGNMGKVMEVFNPLKTHVHKRFWMPFKKGTESKESVFIRALPSDNPSPEAKRWIEEKELAYQAGLMREVEYQKQVKGDFDYDDDANTLISYDAIMDYFNGQHIKPTGERFLTIDPARLGKDNSVFRVWDGWVCIARFVMEISKVYQVVEKAKRIQEKYGITNSKTVVDSDGVGGGVEDYLGCLGFVNNSRPVNGEEFKNLKSQCYIKMADKIQKRQVVELSTKSDVIEITTEEMQMVKMKDLDSEGKQEVIRKKDVKNAIGRSPDEWDSIMLRYYFELHEDIYFS